MKNSTYIMQRVLIFSDFCQKPSQISSFRLHNIGNKPFFNSHIFRYYQIFQFSYRKETILVNEKVCQKYSNFPKFLKIMTWIRYEFIIWESMTISWHVKKSLLPGKSKNKRILRIISVHSSTQPNKRITRTTTKTPTRVTLTFTESKGTPIRK